MSRQKTTVFPEVLSPGDWKVTEITGDGQPRASRKSREVAVPLGDTEQEQGTRDHEMSHVEFSPSKVHGGGLPMSLVFAVEDSRVNELAIRSGVDSVRKLRPIADLDQALDVHNQHSWDDGDPEARAIAAGICLHSTRDWPRAKEILEHQGRKGLRVLKVIENAHREIATKDKLVFRDTLRVVRQVVDQSSKKNDEDDHKNEGEMDDQGEMDPLEFPFMNSLALERGSYFQPVPVEATGKLDGEDGGEGELDQESGRRWGRIARVETPKLTLPVKVRMRKLLRNVPVETGSLVRNTHRMYVDQKLFNRRKYEAAGAILVDGSGSMSLSSKDIDKILDESSAALIAVYSAGEEREDEGGIRILAKGGRRVARHECDSPFGGMNVIDGPALRWLTQFEGPYFWVTDGGITGVGDCPASEKMRLEVLRLKQRHNIQQVRSAEDVIRGLRAR